MEPGAHHAGDGRGGEQLKVNALGVLVHKSEKLNAYDGYFLVNTFNIARLVKLKLLSFVKNPAVKPVLAGVLVAPGGAYLFLFCHELL